MRNPAPVVAARLLPTAPRREEGKKGGEGQNQGDGGGQGARKRIQKYRVLHLPSGKQLGRMVVNMMENLVLWQR